LKKKIKCHLCFQEFENSPKFGILDEDNRFTCYPDLAQSLDKFTVNDLDSDKQIYEEICEVIIMNSSVPDQIRRPMLIKLLKSKWCTKYLGNKGLRIEFDDINEIVKIHKI
jgi:hypothetical protein